MSADVRHPDLQSMKAFAFPTWPVREAAGGLSEVVHDRRSYTPWFTNLITNHPWTAHELLLSHSTADYSAWPNAANSCRAFSERSRGISPLVGFLLCT